MKAQRKLAAALAALLLLSNSFSALTVKADEASCNISVTGDTEEAPSPENHAAEEANEASSPESQTEEEANEASSPESQTEEKTNEASSPESQTEETDTASFSEPETEETPSPVLLTAAEKNADMPVSHEAFTFCANLEWSPQSWVVKGVFSEFPSDVSHIQPLYSLDDTAYQSCGSEWDSHMIKTMHLTETRKLICLYGSQEPLKSYLEEKLDLFYLKLRLSTLNGVTYETPAAVIERSGPRPAPDELEISARFASVMLAKSPVGYGRYQLTVSADVTAEDIFSFLPDTLPVEVHFQKKGEAFATGIVDCPVTWAPLSLPRLTAGESVTIPDAAEEITVPAGTPVSTPMGVFELNEPLGLASQYSSDEVRLVLNVIPEDGNPTGVLSAENAGLEAAFNLKPTGAAAIRTYTFSEGASEWTALSELPLEETVDARPSVANSAYALVLAKDQEPYRSYLAAKAAGENPAPFFIGLKIEGGVYDGRQLVLAWPDTYQLPPNLPKVGGAGGNESNAGSGNKADSTESGQRPHLPQEPDTPTNTDTPTDADTRTDFDTSAQPDTPVNPNAPANSDASAQPDAPENANAPTSTDAPESTDISTDLDASVQPGAPENPDTPGHFSALPETPAKSDTTSASEAGRQNQDGEYASGQSGTAIQISADTNAEEGYPADADSVSFNTEENTERNTGIDVYGFLLAVAAAGICIITVFGKTATHKILNALRRLLPQK